MNNANGWIVLTESYLEPLFGNHYSKVTMPGNRWYPEITIKDYMMILGTTSRHVHTDTVLLITCFPNPLVLVAAAWFILTGAQPEKCSPRTGWRQVKPRPPRRLLEAFGKIIRWSSSTYAEAHLQINQCHLLTSFTHLFIKTWLYSLRSSELCTSSGSHLAMTSLRAK